MESVKINPAEIPKLELKLFCLELVAAAERFYSDPVNMAAFERWLSERRKNENTKTL